jgi:drug/metabolite transporter (DMT)-like permease
MLAEKAPHDAPRRARGHWLGIAWLGFADALNFVLFFAAYRATSVAIAVLTHYLTPILVAIAAPFALRERATARTAIAVAVSFGGLLLLLDPWDAERRAGDVLGAALGAGSAVFYASNVLVNKRLSVVFRPTELMFFHGVIATPLLALFVPHETWGGIDLHAAAIIAAGALGPGALAGLFFVWGLRDLPASHVSTLTLLEPLVAVVAGAVAFGEHLGAGALGGAALILAGAAAVVWQRQLAK